MKVHLIVDNVGLNHQQRLNKFFDRYKDMEIVTIQTIYNSNTNYINTFIYYEG